MNYIQAIRNIGQKIHKIKSASVLGRINNEQFLVSIIKQKTNINENATHNYQDIYILDQQFRQISQGDYTISNTITSYNQDRTRFVKYQTLQEDNKPKQVIEIYKNGNLEQSIKQEFHDDILNNVIVGEPFNWNKSGDKLLYVARSKPDQAKTFFTISKEEELEQGWNYRKYKQSWGEQMDNVYGTNIYLLNLNNSKIYQVVTDKFLLQAYPQFDENDNIIFQGYKEAPEFRYGIIHCFNRPSNIYLLKDPILIDLANKEKQLQEHIFQGVIVSKEEVSIKPKISPDYKKLIYFSAPLNIQHMTYLSLKILDLDTQETKDLVPIIHENLLLNARNDKQQRDKIFNGICGYYDHLQGTSWTKDSIHYLFSSLVCGQSQIYSVNVNNAQVKSLTHLKPSNNTHNANYLNYDQDNDILFYTDEDSLNPPQVHAIKQLSSKLNDQQELESLSIEQQKVQFKEDIVFHDEAEGFVWQLEAPLNDIGIPTYFGEDRPLALLLHGGPHGATQSVYTVLRELLLRQGFIILAPNFTGSASYGQKFIEKLSGQIGIPDTIEILNMVKQVGCKRAFVFGGSYGGYMSAFLAAHHSDQFKLAIIMNPALNFAFMVNCTDIPEWCGSSILNKKFSWNLSKEDYIQLYEKSVIKEHIKIPSLLLLGQKDTRVPYQQSLALRAQTIFNGVDIQTYVYPEADHSLGDSINTGYDVIAKSIIFISQNI